MMSFLILLSLAIAPGIAISLFVYFKDKYEREPWHLLFKAFINGVLVTFLAGLLEFWADSLIKTTPELWMVAIEAFLMVALIEEGCKYYLLVTNIYHSDAFNEPFDGITYAVIISMGFATFENIFYVYRGGLEVAFLRMLTAVPAHGIFGVMMGFFVGLAKFRPHSAALRWTGLLTAVFFHGAYDFFLFQEIYPLMTYGALLVLLVGLLLSLWGMRVLSNLSPFKQAENPLSRNSEVGG